jgi:hypothetical protein
LRHRYPLLHRSRPPRYRVAVVGLRSMWSPDWGMPFMGKRSNLLFGDCGRLPFSGQSAGLSLRIGQGNVGRNGLTPTCAQCFL